MIEVKKTTELTDAEIKDILSLYNLIMQRDRTAEQFRKLYLNTVKGYSYHVMLYDEKELVGLHSGIPFSYQRDGEKFIAGLGLDTMIAPKHRDFFNVRDMFTACEKAMLAEGCILRIGFPNDNSYPVLKKGLKYKDIGKMDTYFLPLKIGGIKENLKILNPLSKLFSLCIIGISYFSLSSKVHSFSYGKDRESFDKVRYKWFGEEDYKTLETGGAKAYYKVQFQEGVKTLFIIDVWPLAKRSYDKVVRAIYRKEHKGLDMIVYVGHLPFTPTSLVTMPRKFEPKHFNFTCKPLDKSYFDDSLYDINNWDVNLSNYDLL